MSYRTWALAEKCIRRSLQTDGDSLRELVVYDDGSPEQPPESLTEELPVRLVCAPSNRGYTRAINSAFSSTTASLVVVFDSDAHPITAFADVVRERFDEDPELGVLGFRAINSKGEPAGSFHGTPGVLSLILGQRLYARVAHLVETGTSTCVFSCCMAVRRTAWEQVDGFDESFDFLDADIDFSMRIALAGWKVQVEPRLVAFHEGGGSPQTTRKRVARFYLNRWHLLNKHKLIRFPTITRSIVLWRLRLELLVLQLIGPFMFGNPEILNDKITGRRELLILCVQQYRQLNCRTETKTTL